MTLKRHRRLPVVAALALASCSTEPLSPPSAVIGPPPPPALSKTAEGYALPAPIPDLTSYTLIRTDGGEGPPREATLTAIADVLATYDVIFLGEVHRHAGVHHAQGTGRRQRRDHRIDFGLAAGAALLLQQRQTQVGQ